MLFFGTTGHRSVLKRWQRSKRTNACLTARPIPESSGREPGEGANNGVEIRSIRQRDWNHRLLADANGKSSGRRLGLLDRLLPLDGLWLWRRLPSLPMSAEFGVSRPLWLRPFGTERPVSALPSDSRKRSAARALRCSASLRPPADSPALCALATRVLAAARHLPSNSTKTRRHASAKTTRADR
jgi:hypothetical protein